MGGTGLDPDRIALSASANSFLEGLEGDILRLHEPDRQ